jgi:hypothetical protein
MIVASSTFNVFALGPREEAWKLHNRLTGVPPKPAILTQMTSLIEQNRREEAAQIAMQNPLFINVVLKNWVKPWSNRDQTSRVDLNDYVATVLGVIRDDGPFDTVLFEDVLYTVNGVTPAYAPDNNTHYRNAETSQVDLSANLVRTSQSALSGVAATAGVITTRAGAEAFFSAGTNRRVNRFTFMNYLCNDFEALHDTTVPDTWVRRDVERNPGGDSRTYKNKCVGCHAGQDALAGAWAYYDYVGSRLVYTPGVVVEKVARPINAFSSAKLVTSDEWVNLWANGQNAKLGWRGGDSGSGGKQMNEMLAHTRAFAECMSTKVFKLVCMKDPVSSVDKATVKANATYFESGTEYSMKSLIARTSAGCMENE